MADAQKTIDLIFNGIDKTGAATMSALDNAKKFTSSLENVTQPIADFTIGAAKLEAGLLGAGLAMTVFAVKTAGDFDAAFREISTLFDAPIADLERFKQGILDYSQGSTQSIEQITGAVYGAISAGVSYTDSLAVVSRAEKLAVAGKAELSETLVVLLSSLKAYSKGTEDAERFSDALFTTVKLGQTTLPELAAGLSQVTSLAAGAGVPFETLLSAVAALTATGMPTSQAITGIKAALSNIIKPTADAADVAGELGINFNATALQSRGFEGVLQDVAKATGGNTETLAKLFGSMEGLNVVMALTGGGMGKFAESLKAMGESSGATEVAFSKMSDAIGLQGQKMQNSLKALLIGIGTPLLDEFGGIAEAIAGIFQALGGSVKDGGLKELEAYIKSVFGGIEDSLKKVAKNLPAALASADFGDFKAGIESVLNAMKSLFGSIDLSSVEGLKLAIETVGVAFLGLSKYTAGVIEVFKPLFDTLISVGKGAKDVDLSFIQFGGNIGGIATQLNVVLPLFSTMLGILTVKSGLGLVTEFKALVTILPTLATALTGAGVALTAYFAADKVIALVSALAQWKEANDHLSQSQTESAAITEKSGLSLDRFAQTTGLVAKTVDEAVAMIDRGTVVWSTATNGWVKAGSAMADAGAAAQSSVGGFEKSNQAMLDNFAASEKAARGSGALAVAQQEVVKYAMQTVPIFDAITGKISGYEQQLVKSATGTISLTNASDKASASLAKVTAETAKAEEQQRKWREEVEKMKFEEKLKLIEQQTKIMTAQIEADSRKAVAAFESIGITVQDTGKLLGDLFGLLANSGTMDWSSLRRIEDQIDLENKRRGEALDLQKRLTEAQLAQMKAQTDALLKGDGLIKIDGAGLQPHLEGFMWEILRTIQVKVNKDGLKLLLGS